MTDIAEAQDLLGMRHYLSNAAIDLLNSFVVDEADLTDSAPPVWTNSCNANINPFPTPAGPPTPRVGIQAVSAGPGQVTVSWDVALDLNWLKYTLYYDSQPLDFIGDPNLTLVSRLVPIPEVGTGYQNGVGPGIFAHEATVTGLTSWTTYHFCVRAADSVGNEEKNQVVLSATPLGQASITVDGSFSDWNSIPLTHSDPADVADSAGPDWLDVKIANDATDLFVWFTSENAFNLDGSPTYGFSRTLLFIDVDDDAATGYSIAGIGSDLLVAGDGLFLQDVGVFNNGFLETLNVLPTTAVTECELAIPLGQLTAIDAGASQLRILLLNDEMSDFAPDAGSLGYTIVP